MNKVYLLLRNNKQTGPHSLDELIFLAPKHDDLIWIEGKSNGWSYPTEIVELNAYLPIAEGFSHEPYLFDETPYYPHSQKNKESFKKIISPRIHVSLPARINPMKQPLQDALPTYNLEQRADELRKKVQEFTASNSTPENKFQTNFNRSIDTSEKDHTRWSYQQKKTKTISFSKKNLFVAIIFIVLVTGSYFLINSLVNNSRKVQQVAVQPLPQQLDTSKAASVEQTNWEAGEEIKLELSTQSIGKQIKTTSGIKEEKQIIPLAESESSIKTPLEQFSDEKAEPILQEEKANVPSTQEDVKQETIEDAPREKKKTLAEKIDGFFYKIGNKKQKEPSVEEQPNTSKDGTERKSTRRDDETKAPFDQVDITSLVDITANNPDNWMMGVKGLKLTLRNRSNETIKTATVEVSYYNEQNSLVEKKLVYFTNIEPKKSLTVAAPDQRLADHTDFKLLTISAKEDSYAKQ